MCFAGLDVGRRVVHISTLVVHAASAFIRVSILLFFKSFFHERSMGFR